MNLYILHNVRGLCFYTLWDLLVIGICVIVVPSAKPKRQTDLFLAFSSFSVCRYRALLSLHVSRAASMRDFGTAPFRAAALSVWGRARTSLSAWFESTVSHHMAHGLDNPQGRTCNLPCQEKALESLPRCSFPDRMCANQQPRRRTGAVFIWPPERSLERGACV